jgi:hypothetical protein
MLKILPHTAAAGFLTGLLLCSAAAEAIVFNLANRATPRITIRVGGSGGNISEVEFNVPATRIGNGTAVTGSPAISIQLVVRASGASPLTATLSADSLSYPLTNSGGSSSIPFSDISWTAQDGDIPAGTFTGVTDQVIVTFPSSRRIGDWHTFSYANTRDVEAGDYLGRVVYTWAIP